MDELYYIFGNYLYNIIKPTITGDVEIFKYILGKIYLDYISDSYTPLNILNMTS